MHKNQYLACNSFHFGYIQDHPAVGIIGCRKEVGFTPMGKSLKASAFNTEEKIKLVRFDSSVFNKEHKDIMDNMFSFKFHKKNPLLTNSLSESYNAFKNARYNKRVTKIIKENLIE